MPEHSDRGDAVSASVGDYLKAIWLLGDTDSVSTKDLAAHLRIAPASVSEMLSRLHEVGLVRHVPYHGVSLASKGHSEALRLVRRHRLIESFLVEHLGYTWDEVHEEAEVLEHAVSDRFIERLDGLLGEPTHDPHGDPIPSSKGLMPDTPDVPLSEAPEGIRFLVSRLRTQDSESLATLGEMGLLPGQLVQIVERLPLDEEIIIHVEDERHHIGLQLAALVHGELLA
jgi:DtxR family Mn-dependent transcriptional regulator